MRVSKFAPLGLATVLLAGCQTTGLPTAQQLSSDYDLVRNGAVQFCHVEPSYSTFIVLIPALGSVQAVVNAVCGVVNQVPPSLTARRAMRRGPAPTERFGSVLIGGRRISVEGKRVP